MMEKKVKKPFHFPSAFTILLIIMVIAVGATWIVPSGTYSKLTYNSTEKVFVIKKHGEADTTMPATKETLDKLNIKIELKNFTDGVIRKPIAIPNSYQRVPQHPKGLGDIAESMVRGTIEGADVMAFIFVLGGLIGVINKTGAFNAGLTALSKRSKGNEFMIVFMVCVLMALGGTTCGMEEEAVAFYPILVPVFLSLGYDSIVCVGAIFLASSMGTAFSTINPFSVVIASNAAYTYEDREEFYKLYMQDVKAEGEVAFDWRKKVILVLFVAAFPILVWGVMSRGWWFPQMAASFLTIAFFVMILSGLSEQDIVNSFTKGASELVGVSLIIGLARGVNMVLEEGLISDTILDFSTHLVTGMPPALFIMAQLVVFFFLGLIVPSSSGLAVLSMPIMAPLADTVGVPRHIVVSAYMWGQYAMLFLAPTGLVLVTLQMLNIPFNKWVKFVLPMIGALLAIATVMLLTEVALS